MNEFELVSLGTALLAVAFAFYVHFTTGKYEKKHKKKL